MAQSDLVTRIYDVPFFPAANWFKLVILSEWNVKKIGFPFNSLTINY